MTNYERSDSDIEAQAQAEAAVQQGTTLIRSHLAHHIVHNPDISFVTWIATLHPENASVVIDQRFLIPGNPWWTVYEEAKDVPTATAVPQDQLEYEAQAVISPDSRQKSDYSQPHFCLRCSPLNLMIGCTLSLVAILTVITMEFASLAVYFISALFFHMAQLLSPRNVFTGLFHSCFMLMYSMFAIVDSLLLLVSVILTECIAVIASISTVCVGGLYMAGYWHQYIRRTCHLTRWASRSPFASPPRHLFCAGYHQAEPPLEEDHITVMSPRVDVAPAKGTIVVLDPPPCTAPPEEAITTKNNSNNKSFN